MAKNLEKKLPKSEDAIETPTQSAIELDDGIMELDDELELDDDGNFISGSLDDEAEPETEEPEDGEDADEPDGEEGQEEEPETAEPDEEEPEEPEQQPKATTKRKLSPAEKKLVELKRENKRLKEAQRQKQETKQAEDLVKSYVDQGYDEDTAKRYAREDMRSSRLEQEIELLRFEKANARVFDIYPDAAENSEDIMRRAKAADMTAEQVCRALYGEAIPAYEQRALKAARGESVRETTRTTSDRVAVPAKEAAYTARERAFKRELERRFNGGKPLTAEEFARYRRKVE